MTAGEVLDRYNMDAQAILRDVRKNQTDGWAGDMFPVPASSHLIAQAIRAWNWPEGGERLALHLLSNGSPTDAEAIASAGSFEELPGYLRARFDGYT